MINNRLIFIIFILLTLVINFIDLKDYAGDKHDGIKTLPVILGVKASKILIGIFFLVAYFSASYVFGMKPAYAYSYFILGITQFILINRKNYSEKPVFLVYLLSLLGVVFII